MGPIQAITTCFAKSFQFSGRASRAEFWWFTLFVNVVLLVAFGVFDVWLYGIDLYDEHSIAPATELLCVVMFFPATAVTMRRLHDCGWQGWPAPVVIAGFYLTSYITMLMKDETWPWISQLETGLLTLNVVLLIAALFPGKPGHNPYGPNPNEVPQ